MIESPPEVTDPPEECDEGELSSFQEWYYRNREQHIENVKERKNVLVEWLSALREGFECESCGESHPACIELHHTSENEYDIRLGNMAREGYGKETILAEIERGKILCSNCHRILHYENNDPPWKDTPP